MYTAYTSIHGNTSKNWKTKGPTEQITGLLFVYTVQVKKALSARWLEAAIPLPIFVTDISTNPQHKNLVRNPFVLMFTIVRQNKFDC